MEEYDNLELSIVELLFGGFYVVNFWGIFIGIKIWWFIIVVSNLGEFGDVCFDCFGDNDFV